MKIIFACLALVASAFAQSPAPGGAAGKRPFTFEDMMRLKRVGAPVPSPDGKWVVFDCVDVDLGANTKTSHLWIVAADGKGEARRLSQTANDESRPRFSSDGKKLIWTSKATDPSQIWMSSFTPERGGLDGVPHQVTDIPTGADGGIWTPDGKNVVFVSAVYPNAETKQREEAQEKTKVKAKLFTSLLYRHWNSFTEFKRSHLFVVSSGSDATNGHAENAQDLTPGDHDVPPFSLGGSDMYDMSPDSRELAYTSNIDVVGAISTNNEVFVVPLSGGEAKKVSNSPGNDNTPRYSSDGRFIAWKSMARAGFEADKERLFLFERATNKISDLTQDFDRSVGSFCWDPKRPQTIYFTAEDRGESPISTVSLSGQHEIKELWRTHADDLVLAGNGLFFGQMSISAPTEISFLPLNGEPKATQITHVNDALLAQIEMPKMESFTFQGAHNDEVQGFLIRPPGFDAGKKYPLKFLIHGGPQGAWGNSWTYRWNAQLFAADGYVVVMINFHGSTGYGQKFTDSISGDWGGAPFEDLMKGLDYAEKKYPFIDKNREAALGASYGGYMANWILGHTDRFKCIVSHDGMFNTEAAYGTTEELWFPEWEFKGPPWKQRELYRKFSPHLFADKFKTPTLVIHGQLDYRLDVSEGFQLFTTLQRLGVPSEMLYFPDEGHWVLKPQNSQLWYKTVNAWVDRWCKG